MLKIKKYVHQIDDELSSAKEYLEKSIEYRVDGNPERSKTYKEMAEDEIRHANAIHEIAAEDIERISRVYKPTPEMKEKWTKCHEEYVEKMSWLESMIEM